ncbi:MAG: hypothetical protein ACI8UO_000606 [Verrucomicrobiales bacterium]|jgi:hypothetical protein
MTEDEKVFERSKRASRGISADMSPEAISKRFRILVELNELCAAFSKAELVVERVDRGRDLDSVS